MVVFASLISFFVMIYPNPAKPEMKIEE